MHVSLHLMQVQAEELLLFGLWKSEGAFAQWAKMAKLWVWRANPIVFHAWMATRPMLRH